MKTILIIDDEKDFTFFVKANLELTGRYKVIMAQNGKDGLRAAQQNKPALILLDVMMPGMDGLEVLKRLKESEKTMHIPVIILTAKGDDDTKMLAATSFNEDFIVKPVELKLLASKVDSVLARI